MTSELDHKAIKGTAWAAIDRLGNMGVQFFVNMVLAWLVSPADFACVAILGIFISVSTTLLDGGFASALIQDKDPSPTDFSTIFVWNGSLALGLCTILFFAAPAVESWFGIAQLGNILRATSLVLIFNALSLVQTVRLRRSFRFRTLAVCDLSAAILAGIIAVVTAYNGGGVWSLVTLTVATGAIRSAMLWMLSHWAPSLRFSVESFRRLFSFGGYMVAASILQDISNNLQGIIIGKRVPVEMGYYNQAEKLDMVTSYHLPNMLVQVLFPYFSQLKDDSTRMRASLATSVRLISFVVILILGVLIWVAPILITTLYGDVWLPAVPYFRIFCVGGLFRCLLNVNFYAVASTGHSRELFFWSFYKWGMLIGLIMFGSIWGIYGILWGMVISNLNIFFVNAFLCSRFTGYSVASQLRAIAPAYLTGLAAMGAVFVADIYAGGLHLWVCGAAFALLYLAASRLLRLRALADVTEGLKGLLARRFGKKN